MAYPWCDMVLLLTLPFLGGDMFLHLLPLEKRHLHHVNGRSSGSNRWRYVKVPYVWPYELWGYSLKLRPEIEALYLVGTLIIGLPRAKKPPAGSNRWNIYHLLWRENQQFLNLFFQPRQLAGSPCSFRGR